MTRPNPSATPPLYFWLPRLIAFSAIILISIFAISDLQQDVPLNVQWRDFVIHLVPTYLLTVFLIVACKWGNVGGCLLLVIGLVSSPYVFVGNYHTSNSIGLSFLVILVMTIPFAIAGLLFLINHYRKHQILAS